MIIIDAFSNPRFATKHEEEVAAVILKHVKKERTALQQREHKEVKPKGGMQEILRRMRKQKVIQLIEERPRMRLEIQQVLGLAERSVQQILANLVRENIIVKSSGGAHVLYSINTAARRKENHSAEEH